MKQKLVFSYSKYAIRTKGNFIRVGNQMFRKMVVSAAIGLSAAALVATSASALSTAILGSSAQNGAANEADIFANDYGAYTLSGVTWDLGNTAPIVGPGSQDGQYKSPWVDTGLENGNNYFSVGGNNSVSPRVVSFDETRFGLRLLWGSIDSYNKIGFSANGSDYEYVTGSQVAGMIGDDCGSAENFECVALVEFSDVEFNYLSFFSENDTDEVDRAAFEFAVREQFGRSFVTPVPVPAGVWLMGTALAGFGYSARRRRKSG